MPFQPRPDRKTAANVSLVCHTDDSARSDYTRAASSADNTVGFAVNADTCRTSLAPYECRIPLASTSAMSSSETTSRKVPSSCPYHASLSSQEMTPASAAGQDPMTRFLATTASRHPGIFSERIQPDPRSSVRCICANIPDYIVHALAQTAINLCNESDARPDAAWSPMQVNQP